MVSIIKKVGENERKKANVDDQYTKG